MNGCIRRNIVCGLLAAAGLWLASGAGAESPADMTAQPLYRAKERRDPFVQPQAGRLRNMLDRIDIGVLRLTGVIRTPQRTLALFTPQTGPKFGFLLKDGRLYRENHQTVPGVQGVIRPNNDVVLTQNDRQMVFQLQPGCNP